MKKVIWVLIAIFSATHACADDIVTNMPKDIRKNMSAVIICVTIASEAYAKSTCETPNDISVAAKNSCNEIFEMLSSSIEAHPFKNSLIDTSSINGRKALTSSFDIFLNREITTSVVKTRSSAKNCN